MEIKHGHNMKIQYCSNYEEMSQSACDSIIRDLKISPNLLLCLATGNSPTGTYNKMVNIGQEHPEFFNELSIVKLDEWGGLKEDDPDSCETYLRHKILIPLQIPNNRYISFQSDSKIPEEECERIQKEIDDKGPIDVCILGLGKNGHIGFNEPAESLSAGCHIGQLSKTSLQHEMTNAMKNKPSYGITLGMADILKSKKIILLVTGVHKEKIIKELLTAKITTHLPASFLWLHTNVECFIDSESL